jgi:hypothetical protein
MSLNNKKVLWRTLGMVAMPFLRFPMSQDAGIRSSSLKAFESLLAEVFAIDLTSAVVRNVKKLGH